jgi:hypothetical protein
MRDNAPLPGVFPDYPVPIVRNAPDGVRELTMRWGMGLCHHLDKSGGFVRTRRGRRYIQVSGRLVCPQRGYELGFERRSTCHGMINCEICSALDQVVANDWQYFFGRGDKA